MVADTRSELKFMVTCLEGATCKVYFEPEGAEVPLDSGEMLTVELTGEDDGQLEISYTSGGLVIGAWKGARTRVWDRQGRQVPV
jgi:hypothetical protein